MMTKYEKILIVIIISSWILIAGITSNYSVIKVNDCKMPVLGGYEDKHHSSFSLSHKPELWYLSDIIDIGDWIISVGDILLMFGFLVPILLGVYLILKIKEYKNG